MNFTSRISDISEVSERKGTDEVVYDNEILDKFDKLFGDDKLKEVDLNDNNDVIMEYSEIEDKFNGLFEEEREKASYYDDNGIRFKRNDMELLPNAKYELGTMKYQADYMGRIKAFEGIPISTPEGERDIKAQEYVGGKERKENDQGGHLLARILGGSKGIENMVAMWEKVNTGPYKKMENEIASALKENKKVMMEGDLEYTGDSQRPSKIAIKYTINNKETVAIFDNNEGSKDLLNEIQNVAEENAFQDIQDEIEDAESAGEDASILSVREKYDESGGLSNIEVCMRYDGENHYRNIMAK